VAIDRVCALLLSRTTLTSLLEAHSVVALRFIDQLVRRIRQLEEQLENAHLPDDASRVVHALLRLNPRSEQAGSLPISPAELSALACVRVERTKELVERLGQSGYVRMTRERLEVTDVENLRRLFSLLEKKEEVRAGFP
jgi:CRP-like cAMP-binding protein